jgi:hypothetical protein
MGRLHALEREFDKIGRQAGRRASAGMASAGDQIDDAIAAAVSEIVDRFRSGRRLAGEEAVRVERGRAPPPCHAGGCHRDRNTDRDGGRNRQAPLRVPSAKVLGPDESFT